MNREIEIARILDSVEGRSLLSQAMVKGAGSNHIPIKERPAAEIEADIVRFWDLLCVKHEAGTTDKGEEAILLRLREPRSRGYEVLKRHGRV